MKNKSDDQEMPKMTESAKCCGTCFNVACVRYRGVICKIDHKYKRQTDMCSNRYEPCLVLSMRIP